MYRRNKGLFTFLKVVVTGGLFLLINAASVSADNAVSSCVNTTVNNDASNICYTITPPSVDPGGFSIDGSEGGGEWSGAKTKNLGGDMAGSFKVLRTIDSIYLVITVNDGTLFDSDRISIYFDVLHNHAVTTDDIEFLIRRNNSKEKVTDSGTSPWNPALLGSEVSISSSGAAWTVEMKLHANDFGTPDLPLIMGFGIEAESLDSGDLASWPTNLVNNNPANSWANLKSRYPIEYMIAIDQSGSMLSDSKWDNAITAANFLANSMSILRDSVYFTDQLGMVSFSWPCSGSDDTEVAIGLADLSAFPVGDYAGGITAPVSSNCTPIGSGLDATFTALGTGSEETQRVVLLLSDGLHNRPTTTLLPTDLSYNPCGGAAWDLCPDADHEVQVNTVAFGEGDWAVDTALLNDISNHFQGAFGSTYNIADDPNDLKATFISSLDELYQMNIVHDGASAAEVAIDPNNRRLVAVAAWSAPASAATFKLQHKTNPGDPWADVACTSSADDTTVGFAVCSVNEPNEGTWRAVDNANNPLAADRLFVLLDLNLRARFAVDQVVHGTGMDIVLTADLNQAGEQLTHDTETHPVEVTVEIKEPGEGLGTFLSTNSLDDCQNIQPQLPDIAIDNQYVAVNSSNYSTYTGTAAAGHTGTIGDPPSAQYQLAKQLLSECGLDSLQRNTEPGLKLYDDGTHGDVTANDGLYTLRFTNTRYEGSYVFNFNAGGKTPSGDSFTRTKTLAEYVRVEVDPDNTIFDSRTISQTGSLMTIEYYVIPRDISGEYMGPGHMEQLEFRATDGNWMGPVRDYNNGIYSRVLNYDESQDRPVVTATVQGKELSPIKVFKPFELVPFIGLFFFDNSLGLDDGTVVGARMGYRVTNQLALEVEGGITFTDTSTAGDSGNVIQTLINARYDLYALSSGRWLPYVTAGAGYVFFRDFGNDDEAFTIHGGAGATFDLGESFGLRVDARVFQIGSAMNAGATTNTQVTGGLLFRF